MKKVLFMIPRALEQTYSSITALTDRFCADYLNDEYADLAQSLTATLCRLDPSPLLKGKENAWASGIVYALGYVNFLFDKNLEPYVDADTLSSGFGVTKSAAYSKSKFIRDILGLIQFVPDWCLPGLIDINPLVWWIEIDGFIIDLRFAPRSTQELAYQKGLIPYIPE